MFSGLAVVFFRSEIKNVFLDSVKTSSCKSGKEQRVIANKIVNLRIALKSSQPPN